CTGPWTTTRSRWVRLACASWSRPQTRTGARRCSSATCQPTRGCRHPTATTIDGDTVDVEPGGAVCVRRGQIHGFANHGDVDATFLAIATPALFGPAYFREIAEVLAASAGGPPNLDAIGAVM